MTTPPDQFLAELTVGRFRWDLLTPFPRPSDADRDAGDKAVAGIETFVAGQLGPMSLDDDRRLPQQFYDNLRASDYLRLQVPERAGGLGLSDYNTFRVLSAAARVSGTVGFMLATHNGIGLPALLPALPDCAPRDLVLRRLGAGVISGWADTEPVGAGNDHPTVVATPVGDGAYSITGDKVFISNGAVADDLIVSAATPGADSVACLFIVDTRTAGFVVSSTQEVIGFPGLPLGALRLDDVRVPAERVLSAPTGNWRLAPLFEPVSSRGRLYLVSGAALAIAGSCLRFQRDFARRRCVNGLSLDRYPAIQDLVAASLADVFAMDSVVRWCLLGHDDATNLTVRYLDRRAAKNMTTLACWRVVDQTMSLLAAEGAETARSKARRGAAPLPVERLFRDARILRITGGVDFAVDVWAAEAMLARSYDPAPANIAQIESDDLGLRPADGQELSPRNREHLVAAAAGARQLARDCLRLVRDHPDRDALLARQRTLGAVGRTVGELFAMAVVLARTASNVGDDAAYVQGLADVFCTAARRRLAGLRPDLDGTDAGGCAEVSGRWLRSGTEPGPGADDPAWMPLPE
jgi:alkylation response protein AidB-like acyl-CoA dehydrogenase